MRRHCDSPSQKGQYPSPPHGQVSSDETEPAKRTSSSNVDAVLTALPTTTSKKKLVSQRRHSQTLPPPPSPFPPTIPLKERKPHPTLPVPPAEGSHPTKQEQNNTKAKRSLNKQYKHLLATLGENTSPPTGRPANIPDYY